VSASEHAGKSYIPPSGDDAIVLEQRESRRIKSGSSVAIASRRTAEGASCFVLASGHTFSGLAGKTEIFTVLGRHTGEGRRARGAARLIVDAPVTYGVSGAGVFDVRTGGLIGVVEGFRRFLGEVEQAELLPP
jgi:hypothetical protein